MELPFIQVIDFVFVVAEPPIFFVVLPGTLDVEGFFVLVAEPEITGALDGVALAVDLDVGDLVTNGLGRSDT